MEMVETSTLDRGTMARLLTNVNLSAESKVDIALADAYIDEALDAIDDEEPSLLDWLQNDPELQNLQWANLSTMYWLLARDMKDDEVSFEQMVTNLDKILGRVRATIAWRAAMRERKGFSAS